MFFFCSFIIFHTIFCTKNRTSFFTSKTNLSYTCRLFLNPTLIHLELQRGKQNMSDIFIIIVKGFFGWQITNQQYNFFFFCYFYKSVSHTNFCCVWFYFVLISHETLSILSYFPFSLSLLIQFVCIHKIICEKNIPTGSLTMGRHLYVRIVANKSSLYIHTYNIVLWVPKSSFLLLSRVYDKCCYHTYIQDMNYSKFCDTLVNRELWYVNVSKKKEGK